MKKKWPKTKHYKDARKLVSKVTDGLSLMIDYRPKVKIHGTNASVWIPSDPKEPILAQSRKRILDALGKDNHNFRAYTEKNKELFESLRNPNEDLCIFGEWFGPGVQRGVAASLVPRRFFAVFAVFVGNKVVVEPKDIEKLLGGNQESNNLFVLPWATETRSIPLGKITQDFDEAIFEKIGKEVQEVEREDPWIRDTFGVSGIGEGYVFFPVSELPGGLQVEDLLFKVKGEKHQVKATKKLIEINPEILKTQEKFLSAFVTENRLEQIFNELCQEHDEPGRELTGAFLRSFARDVQEEGAADLAEVELSWRDIQKPISTAARQWFLNKVDEI